MSASGPSIRRLFRQCHPDSEMAREFFADAKGMMNRVALFLIKNENKLKSKKWAKLQNISPDYNPFSIKRVPKEVSAEGKHLFMCRMEIVMGEYFSEAGNITRDDKRRRVTLEDGKKAIENNKFLKDLMKAL